jgi:hypothetical protein
MGSPERGSRMSGPSRESLEAQRETKDMGHLWVAFFGGALMLGLVTLLAFLWGLQSALGSPPDRPALRSSALAHAGDSATEARFRERAPGLFPDPPGDLRRARAAQARQAPGYAWIDRGAGVIGIPVDRAMERIVEAGWPRWNPPATEPPPEDAGRPAGGEGKP